ncbi:unnamed protein product [Diatraea saccharalis]|uniref:Uncharacterized protein n=1 Tax=Diatraea saccharalis TaxID=40085 RepID=A0A9N9REG3_9NEOP|nr:unnamed protein product [Diatraea saccharalis]
MDPLNLDSGDNNKSPRSVDDTKEITEKYQTNESSERQKQVGCLQSFKQDDTITPKMIEDNESKLKERIAQCRDIIESLKLELNKEKSKLGKDNKNCEEPTVSDYNPSVPRDTYNAELLLGDLYSSDMYSTSVDDRLNCDESLIEYEKQLQRYQNTLNMAQIEKKNAIRKQMLAKAFKLKLLEVENQCNIELLRVKQSLQCLEPLQMIANKWKTCNNSTYDIDNFELIPRFPELSANSGSDINSFREDCDSKASPEKSVICALEGFSYE